MRRELHRTAFHRNDCALPLIGLILFMLIMLAVVCGEWHEAVKQNNELRAQIARDKQDWKNLFVSPKTP